MKTENNNTKPFYNTTIPSDWKVQKLGVLVEIVSGNSPSLFNLKNEGKYPYLKVEDLNNCKKYQETSRQFSDDEKHIVPENSVIFPKRGAAILNNKVRINTLEVQMDSNLMAIYSNSEILNNEYLYYQITFEKLYKIADTSTIPQINNKHITPYSIKLPPLPEQRAIAHVLSLMDTAINKNNQLIAQKELRKLWLMQNLLTGKKRLKGFSGEWREVALKDIFNRITRKNGEVNTNVVTISAQRGFIRQTDFFNKTIASEILDNYFLVKKGEFCYNKSYSNGYPWGATKRLNDFDKAVVTTLYICFGIKDETKTNGNYFEQFFEANYLDKGLTKIAHEGGRAHGLLNVTPFDFFSLKITVPQFEEQTAIAQVLQAADKEIQLLKTKTEKLREQKKGMMQVLLTGKKRLFF
ncbi:MAG: restriction endonuclease subunit S [Bacteroidetes bacterium]|nr:restriction endonuclease subunit S [Bacteroidota bacterium]